METLQWTLLVGLLGMVAYVLWSRLKASYAKGVAPRVEADWEEAVVLQGDVLEVTVKCDRRELSTFGWKVQRVSWLRCTRAS